LLRGPHFSGGCDRGLPRDLLLIGDLVQHERLGGWRGKEVSPILHELAPLDDRSPRA
jgi:hypothetical protein